MSVLDSESFSARTMQTVNLNSSNVHTPWLEVTTSSVTQRIDIERFPFTIGRSDSCSLPVPSTRVSREHAVIRQEGMRVLLKDCGSTNGTLVNGQRIVECQLNDGDVLVFADVEYTFHLESDEALRRTVTQVIDHVGNQADDDDVRQTIQIFRARQEMILHRAIRLQFLPIVELSTLKPIGYSAAPFDPLTDISQTVVFPECRTVERKQELTRLLAVERATQLPTGSELFVNLEIADVGADDLPGTLSRLQQILGTDRRLVAVIPDASVADIAYFRNFLNHLRNVGLGITYDGFTGGVQQLRNRREFPADYVRLSPAAIRGIDRSSERQRQLADLVLEANAQGCRLIAAGVHTENEAAACSRAGVTLATGELFGTTLTMDAAAD